MPNHCNNYLVLTHPDTAQIERARKAMEEGKFFTEFFPCPEELNDSNLSSFGGDNADEKDKMRQAMLEKYGYPSWYEWNIANWGTKWDAYDFGPFEESESDNELVVQFDTAWAPPIGFYDALVDLGFGVDAMYNEFGCAFCGHYIDGSDDYHKYNQSGNGIPAEVDEQFGIRDCLAEWNSDDEEEDSQETIDMVLTQIQSDIEGGDLTAIEELLKSVPLVNLKAYLPEES
jgi:hypothetical protein